MRIAAVLILVLLTLTACESKWVDEESKSFVQRDPSQTLEKPAQDDEEKETLPPVEQNVLSYGEFRPGAYRGAGVAAIVQSQNGTRLVLTRFQVERGVDMRVKLTGEGTLELGQLKGYSGTYEYEIPSGTDLSGYDKAIIYSGSTGTIFTSATLS